MQTDVEYDAGRTQTLSHEHSEAVAWIFEVAEFFHEALSVESPAFAVSGSPSEFAAEAVEFVRVDGRSSDLQVVAWHAFVVDGRGFRPRRERVFPLWHGPPHAARTREVIGWARVVDTALVGWSDHALEAIHRGIDLEVRTGELAHGLVGELLHPLAQRIGSVKLACRVCVEHVHRLLDGCAWLDLLGDRFLFCDDAVELFNTPLVGLFEVYLGAEEVT